MRRALLALAAVLVLGAAGVAAYLVSSDERQPLRPRAHTPAQSS